MPDETLSRADDYLTPDEDPTGFVCRVLRIPDSLRILAAVNELLAWLTDPEHWRDSGELSPDESAWLTAEMLAGYLEESMCKIGAIVPVATADPPAWGLLCDGGVHQRLDWPELYAVLHPALIIDADSFRTPDLRGRVLLQAGQGAGLPNIPLGTAAGEVSHTLTETQLPAHSHTYSQGSLGAVTAGAGAPVPVVTAPPQTLDTGSTGNGQPHNNMQPFLALNFYLIGK